MSTLPRRSFSAEAGSTCLSIPGSMSGIATAERFINTLSTGYQPENRLVGTHTRQACLVHVPSKDSTGVLINISQMALYSLRTTFNLFSDVKFEGCTISAISSLALNRGNKYACNLC